MKKLLNYHWPGNIRELDNVIQRALVLADKDTIQEEDILLDSQQWLRTLSGTLESPTAEPAEKEEASQADAAAEDKASSTAKGRLKAQEEALILSTLRKHGGRRQKAAEELGISPRTLRYKLARMKERGYDIP